MAHMRRARRAAYKALVPSLACLLLLGACLTGEPSAPIARTAGAPVDAQPTALAAPGYLRFALSPSGVGNYAGWQLQVVAAASNQGFKPFLSVRMSAGESLLAELWPDHYHVRVLLLGEVERDEWVEVVGDRTSTIDVSIGFLVNSIETAAPTASTDAERWALHELSIGDTYAPLTVVLRPGLEGRYHGPQVRGRPAGDGLLDLVDRGTQIAAIASAEVIDGRFSGEPAFTDGRTVEASMLADYSFPAGTLTHWPNGRRFTGRYDGLEPREGVLDFIDGSQWTGFLDRGEPVGSGRLRTSDGTTFPEAPGADLARFDGTFDCVTPSGVGEECLYFQGERVASREIYDERVGHREASRRAAAVTVATDPGQPAAGCLDAAGDFLADGGLSRLSLDGRGSGRLWQHTYLDLDPHTFEIEFTYEADGDAIRLDYGPGIYKDMTGRKVEQKTVRPDTVSCTYDGRIVALGGKPYSRE